MTEPIATVGDLAGICGHDGTDWLKVKTDANGYLYVVGTGTAGAIEVTQDTPGDLLVGQHQYDGTNWRKSNLLFGFNDVWAEDMGGTATGGSYAKNSATVSAGEIWVLQGISIRNMTRAPAGVAIFGVHSGPIYVCLSYSAAPGVAVPVLATGNFVLGEGGYARVYLGGCVVGDTIEGGLIGYKMKLNM